MSTGSPTAKGTVAAGPSAPNATSDATAVVVVNVGPVKDSEKPASVFTSSIKEEKLADVTNDPSFNAMHSGGGQVHSCSTSSFNSGFYRFRIKAAVRRPPSCSVHLRLLQDRVPLANATSRSILALTRLQRRRRRQAVRPKVVIAVILRGNKSFKI